MFNTRSYPGPCFVHLSFSIREFPVAGTFSLNVFPATIILQCLYRTLKTICGIRPDVFTTVVRVKQFLNDIAVMNLGSGFGFFRFLSCLLESRAKKLSVKSIVQLGRRVTYLVDTVKANLKIEKSKLVHDEAL